MRWFWGFLLILIGLLYLGNNLAWWPPIDIGSLWQYWPLILIIIGLAVLVRSWRFGYIIMILAILASLGFVLFESISNQRNQIINKEATITQISENIPDNITKAKINIESGAVRINVSERSDKLVEGTFESNITEPEITQKVEGDTVTLTIKTNKTFTGWNRGDIKNNLTLKITDKIPVELNINAGASDIALDLRELQISGLNVDSGASKVELTLGDKTADRSKIVLQSGASKLDLKISKNLGVELDLKAPLSGREIIGLKKTGANSYQTDNFNTAAKKISIEINAGVSSISVSQLSA